MQIAPSSDTSHRYPEERRMATVMFADVHGFTPLAEKLDYETISDLIQGIWSRLDAVIESFGGYVDKHMGDGVMAVWGAPFAGDNDAEQAVLAALSLHNALNDYCAHSLVPGANELKLCVGINSGSVFAGYVGKRAEYTVIGDTVNVAHRLQEAAEAGTVVIGESTYRMVRGAFRVRRLPPLTLKGKADPVAAFVVDGAIPTAGRVRYQGADSLATYMVGRESELEQLDTIYRQAMQSSAPTLVVITGDAGLGKSRLLMEFTSQLETAEPAISIGVARSLAQASRVPFYLWKLLWNNWFNISADDPPEVARDKFVREVNRLWGKQLGMASAVEAAHLIGSIVGLEWPNSRYLAAFENDRPGQIRRAFELCRELLHRVCAARPTVLWLDDLHWADRSSLDLLAYLFEPNPSPLPLLVLCSARPEFVRQQPRVINLARVITLHPLAVDARFVAAAYPDLRSLPPAVLDELAERGEGNPYFLEEIVKSLLKPGGDGELSVEQIVERLHAQPPESLRSMIQARLDVLSREARSVALLASVVGRVFWVGAVISAARVSAGAGTGLLSSAPETVVERVIQDGLRQLVRAELAFPRASSRFSNEQEYIFKHTLLREVAYSLIPNKYLCQYHLAVARWLANHNTLDFLVMAAEHFEQAGALVDAAQHYEQASRLSRSRGATSEALAMTTKAQELRKKAREFQLQG